METSTPANYTQARNAEYLEIQKAQDCHPRILAQSVHQALGHTHTQGQTCTQVVPKARTPMSRLEQLLEERFYRWMKLRELGRGLVAGEDLVRCQQNWRQPYYNVSSTVNGWPPKWTKET